MPEITFGGEQFTLADKIGLMPLMRFAKAAKAGVDSEDMDGLAAMYDLLHQCIADDQWTRFEAAADRERADGEQLMGVVREALEAMTQRPTSRPSDSSDGSTTTLPNSVGDSSSLAVVHRLEQKGRPDLALMVQMAQEAQARNRSAV